MSELLPATGPAVETDQLLADLVAEITDRLHAGQVVDLAEYTARCPQRAEELRRLLPALAGLDGLKSSAEAGEADAAEAPGTLGDFRLVREVGRGGMGVVYEAEQISLGRRVALKVLPFAATLDPRQLQRFHNEARAAAGLHHTNIVPVYAVGQERGVHYYAMQFIDGRTLAQFIAQQRREAVRQIPTTAEAEAAASATTVAPAAQATSVAPRDAAYFRRVAEWGIQAAEALDCAHTLGVLHRDVKPGNLLVDAAGRLWVTDFGLAQVQSDARLTQTGDLVGTLRYMSPEQALAKRVVVDHRTDVYSLGATLYELLTLQPAFLGNDRQELLRQIAFEEPSPPRRLNRAIPTELETIVLKAMEKNPAERYATAQELAEDLERFLKDEPIRARRPSWLQLARKWARRHHPAVRAASVLLLVLLVLGISFALWWVRQRTAGETEAGAALREASRWQHVERWSEALSAVRRARAALVSFGADAGLRQQVDQLNRDLEMAQRLEETRLQQAQVTARGGFDPKSSVAAYAATFAWYGLDVEHEDATAAAEFIRSRSIPRQLVTALDHWANLQRGLGNQEWRRLLAVARAADTNASRNQLRDAWERDDGKAMNNLLASDKPEMLLCATLLLGGLPSGDVSAERVATLLRRAQRHRPDDFWINHELARLLYRAEPSHPAEAIRHFMIAVALRPQSPGAHNSLGVALQQNGLLDEAIAEYRVAIGLELAYATAHSNLSDALRQKGLLDEAIAEAREAIGLNKDAPQPHLHLGNALKDKGRLDEAITEYRKALDRDKDFPQAHNGLGIALFRKPRLDEAIREYQEAIRCKRNYPEAYSNLGAALWAKGRLDDALAACRKAISLKKDYAEAHGNLGNVLMAKRLPDEAIAAYREALRLKKDAGIHNNLGAVLRVKGRLDEAIAEYRKALDLKSDFAEAHCNLGLLLRRQGKFQEAVQELRRGHELGSRQSGWRHPSARDLRDAERIAALDARLPALLKGQEQPKDARERVALARLCQEYKQLFAASARWYGEAFAEEPKLADDLDTQHRYNAACAAALAAAGNGKDAGPLPDKEIAMLRRWALRWLKADLALYARFAARGAPPVKQAVRRRLEHWQTDADLARVRDAEGLATLAEAERRAWQQVWADVADTLARAKGQAATDKKTDLK